MYGRDSKTTENNGNILLSGGLMPMSGNHKINPVKWQGKVVEVRVGQDLVKKRVPDLGSPTTHYQLMVSIESLPKSALERYANDLSGCNVSHSTPYIS